MKDESQQPSSGGRLSGLGVGLGLGGLISLLVNRLAQAPLDWVAEHIGMLWVPVAALLLGGLTVWSAVGWVHKWVRIWLTALCFAAALAFAVMGAIRTQDRTEVQITSPPDNGHVQRETLVEGVATHVPTDTRLWLVVLGYGKIFPQAMVTPDPDGKWRGKVIFGAREAFREPFTLLAVAANARANRAFAGYLDCHGRPNCTQNGIEDPGPDIRVLDRINVVRD